MKLLKDLCVVKVKVSNWDIIEESYARGLLAEVAPWSEITCMRNSLTHEYGAQKLARLEQRSAAYLQAYHAADSNIRSFLLQRSGDNHIQQVSLY